MGILNWVKWKLSGGPSTEELMKIPLMTERWICPEFEFPFPNSKFSQIRKLYPGEFPTQEDAVSDIVLPGLGELGDIKALACTVEKTTTPPIVLLTFPDRVEEDEGMDGMITLHPRESGSTHRLSPIEMVEYQDCFHSIERILLTVFGLKNIQFKKRDMVEFYFEGLNIKEEPTEKEIRKARLMVERTDNISYFNYPLEKRVELFSEHEEAEKWLSENLFGCSFNEFIDFIMKKGGTQNMEVYCSEARKLLEKYNIY